VDKMCDQISDAVLDAHLAIDTDAKVACGKHSLVNMLTIALRLVFQRPWPNLE
jgi:S-adenosylmethionine synthetase